MLGRQRIAKRTVEMLVFLFGYLALLAMAAMVHGQDQSGAHLSLSHISWFLDISLTYTLYLEG